MEGTGRGDGFPVESALINADMLGINYDVMLKVPFWAPLFGMSSDYLKTRVVIKITDSTVKVGRVLTPPEKDALSYHFSKMLITLTYTNPISVAATYGFERATRPKYGFPFYNPKPPKFNPHKFPGLPDGPLSLWMWHGARVLTWYAASKLAVGILVASYAFSVYNTSVAADSRLDAYRKELSRYLQRKISATEQRPTFPRQSPGQPRQQDSQSRWEDQASASASSQQDWAGSERDETPASTPTAWPDNSPSERQESFGQEDHVFDDASPVAPSEQKNVAPQQYTQPSGSAWDKIRSQAQGARGQPGSWAKKRQDEMTSRGAQDGTSYNYTAADEEKSYAKEQAQREFDEMLERERRGQGR